MPELNEAVASYAGHERSVLDAAAQARAEAIGDDPAARAATEQRLGTAIGGVIGVAEAYPDLRASERFAQLQARPVAQRGPHRARTHGLQRHGSDLQRLHRAAAGEPLREPRSDSAGALSSSSRRAAGEAAGLARVLALVLALALPAAAQADKSSTACRGPSSP